MSAKQLLLYISLLVSCYSAHGSSLSNTYVGAVAQHATYVAAGLSPTELLAENLKLYQGLAEMAARNGAQILVFPEFGLTAVRDSSRASLYPFAQPLPDADEKRIPCSDAAFQSAGDTILRTVSWRVADGVKRPRLQVMLVCSSPSPSSIVAPQVRGLSLI